MSKNRQKAAVRKQQKALKETRRRKVVKARLQNERLAKRKRKRSSGKGLTQAMFPDEEHTFWIAHGINYLASDYNEGIWSPLFPELYQEGAELPDAGRIIQTIQAKYPFDSAEWTVQAKCVVGWSAQDREIFWAYKREALRRAMAAYPQGTDYENVIRQPHNATVWEMFHELVEKRAVERAQVQEPEVPDTSEVPEVPEAAQEEQTLEG